MKLQLWSDSKEDYAAALEASEILFGKGTAESLINLKESDFLSIFEGVPQFKIEKQIIESNPQLAELLTAKTGVFQSKGELRRLIDGGGLNINKRKITNIDAEINMKDLLNNKYLLVQKGKKSYNLIIIK